MKLFNTCCNEELIAPDCPCEDQIPLAVATSSMTFDKDDGDSAESVQFSIPFSCCSGSNTITYLRTENPDSLPVDVTIVSIDNDTKSVDTEVAFRSADVLPHAATTGRIKVWFEVCGEEVEKDYLVTIVDTCTNIYPLSLPLITQNLDITENDGDLFSYDIEMEGLVCCYDTEKIDIIEETDPIDPNLGLTRSIPEVGNSFVGTSFTAAFVFDATSAIVGTVNEVRIKVRLCNGKELTQRIIFTVVDTCTPAYPSSPLSVTTVTKDKNVDSGEFTFTKAISFDCCGGTSPQDVFRLVSVAPPVMPVGTGVTMLEPVLNEDHVGNTIHFKGTFDPTTATEGTDETVNFTFRLCDDTNVVVPVRFIVTNSCADVIPASPSTQSYTFDPDMVSNVSVSFSKTLSSYSCCDSGLQRIRISSIATNGFGLTLTNQFATFMGNTVLIGLNWNKAASCTGCSGTVNVSLDICGQTVLAPVFVTVLDYHPCGTPKITGAGAQSNPIALGMPGKVAIIANSYGYGDAFRFYDSANPPSTPDIAAFVAIGGTGGITGCAGSGPTANLPLGFPTSGTPILSAGLPPGTAGGTALADGITYGYEAWATATTSNLLVLTGCNGYDIFIACPNTGICGSGIPNVQFPRGSCGSCSGFETWPIRTFALIGPFTAPQTPATITWAGKVGQRFVSGSAAGRGNYTMSALSSSGATGTSTGNSPGASVIGSVDVNVLIGDYVLVYIEVDGTNPSDACDDVLLFTATC